jgi:hypothetical protein
MTTTCSRTGVVARRIMKVAAAPEGTPQMGTLIFGYHEDRTPTHGYEPTREAAMAAFAKSWRRQWGHWARICRGNCRD